MKNIYIIAITFTLIMVGFGLNHFTTVIEGSDIVGHEKGFEPKRDTDVCVQPPAGLVSWYRAEGNFTDSTGGNSGTQSGGVGFAAGKVGQAFNLDGTDDIISFGNPANLRTTAVTAEAWIRPDTSFGNYRTVVSKWSQSANASWGLFVIRGQNSSTNLLYGIVLNANGQVTDASGGNIPTGLGERFTHVAMTYSAADGIKVYQDGVMVDSDVSVGNIRDGSDVVRIGNDRDNLPTRHFDGLIDEVDIFNRALSAAEIQSIFTADSDGKCAGPAPSPTPVPCTYMVTPDRRTFDSDAGGGVIKVVAPAGCGWFIAIPEDPFTPGSNWLRATTVTSGSGTLDNIPYTVAENTGQNQRTGKVNVIGNLILGQELMVASHEVTQQADDACPVGYISALGSGGNAPDELNQFRSFRDNVLTKSGRGKKHTDDYYAYASEITKLIIFNSSLFFRSKDVLKRYQPIVESVLRRERSKAEQVRSGVTASQADLEPTVVFDSEIDDVTELLAAFSAKASGGLRETLDDLQRDIKDPQVQAEFGVRIEHGEKRPLSGIDENRTANFRDISLFDLPATYSFR